MPEFPEDLNTEHLLDAHINLEPPESVGATPFGNRVIYTVRGGTFEGPRLRGTVQQGGGDWFLTLANGAGELDVRATFRTDEGIPIYVSYRGILDVAPEVASRALRGEEVALSEYYFRTTPRFETGHEAYAWLNKLVCIGVGRLGPNTVGYRVFAVK